MREHGVRGDLIRWVREQQGLSMSEVKARGGPSIGYQCEVEQGKKSSPHPDVVDKWAAVLGVPVAFLRGEIPRYHSNPALARGIASEVAPLVERDRELLSSVDSTLRIAEILRRVSRASPHLSRVVLAYVLGISVKAMDDMMDGFLSVPSAQISALADITGIPKRFLLTGEGAISGESFEEYLPAVDLARSAGLSATALLELVRSALTERGGSYIQTEVRGKW